MILHIHIFIVMIIKNYNFHIDIKYVISKKHSWTYNEISLITMYIDNYGIIHLIETYYSFFNIMQSLAAPLIFIIQVEYEINNR